MEHILPAYNDPLFSILLIIVIALIIAMMTYAWGIYKEQKEEGNLLKFLDKFESSECSLDTSNMKFEPNMLKPLALLAKAFDNAGEYHKAINIYIYLIKYIDNNQAKRELMEHLANTYFNAGFLERSKSIYLEILRTKPRNIKVLYKLGIVYESMHMYDKAKDTITPLYTLGEDTKSLELFFDFSQLRFSKDIELQDKVNKIIDILNKEPSLYRQSILELLKLDTKKAWELIEPSRLDELIDILWFLPNSQLDLDIILSNEKLHTLYYVKGYIKEPMINSGIFSLDILATAKKSGFEDGELIFSYLCKKCKHNFPVSFTRCPNCMALNSIKVEEEIAKSNTKTDYSIL